MKNIGINVNTSKDGQGEILNNLIEILKSNNESLNIKIFKDSIGLEDESTSELEVVIVLGGDGTILKASKFLAKHNVPILGINIGNLGFLAEAESTYLKEAVESLLKGHFDIEERKMIQCRIPNREVPFIALNDIVIAKDVVGRIVKYKIGVNEHYYTTFVSDGVIISTPTGSTAYSLSAGGPIIYPTMDVICITPICSHSLGIRSIVLEGDSKVDIEMEKKFGSVHLAIDGQEIINLDGIHSIVIEPSPYKCKIIKLSYLQNDYFSLLRKKLKL
ncbi:NAD(+)/NADH kinase [Clostridium malenominatum]|uniref:NAD kinase n=1 Tax=Clostridium malenominatum TaxID=1539 RepID=A0ABN1IXZ7_9CLOT